jgi:hypothetical protein
MTRTTPESLARVDFPRLLREDPASARRGLEALIADPEALALYGELQAASNAEGQRLSDRDEWDDLRRHILREGLGPTELTEETLARLALDVDALVELQFDLFSAESPHEPWRALLAQASGEMVDREPDVGVRADAPDAASEDVADEADRDVPRPAGSGVEPPIPLVACAESRHAPLIPVGDIAIVHGERARPVLEADASAYRDCPGGRREQPSWMNRLDEPAILGHCIVLGAYCDPAASPGHVPSDDAHDALALLYVQLLRPSSPPAGRSRGARSWGRCARRFARAGWLRRLWWRVPALCGCDGGERHAGPATDILAERAAWFGGVLSTCDGPGTKWGEWDQFFVVDAAIEAAIHEVDRWGQPSLVPTTRGRIEGCLSCAGRGLDQRPSGSPRGQLASSL